MFDKRCQVNHGKPIIFYIQKIRGGAEADSCRLMININSLAPSTARTDRINFVYYVNSKAFSLASRYTALFAHTRVCLNIQI